MRKKAMGQFTLKVEFGGRGGARGLRLTAHRQQTVGRNALVRHDAEQLARRHAHIVHQHLEVATIGKPLAQLPGIDRGNRQAHILGHFLQRNSVLPAPRAERGREAGTDVAMEVRLWGHRRSIYAVRGSRKEPFRPQDRAHLNF